MTILKQESEVSRIVEYKWSSTHYRIARQRRVKTFWGYRWRDSSGLFSFQCKTIDEYIEFFDWEESRIKIGVAKQFGK